MSGLECVCMCLGYADVVAEDLQDRTSHVHELMSKLRDGTDSIRVLTSDTRSVSYTNSDYGIL